MQQQRPYVPSYKDTQLPPSSLSPGRKQSLTPLGTMLLLLLGWTYRHTYDNIRIHIHTCTYVQSPSHISPCLLVAAWTSFIHWVRETQPWKYSRDVKQRINWCVLTIKSSKVKSQKNTYFGKLPKSGFQLTSNCSLLLHAMVRGAHTLPLLSKNSLGALISLSSMWQVFGF